MKEFLDFAFDGADEDTSVPCPCRKCVNICPKKRRDVHLDLLHHGMDPTYTRWIYHGEESDEESMSQGSGNEEAGNDDSAVRDMLNTLIRGSNIGSNTTDEEEGADANHGDASGSGEHDQEPNSAAKAFFNLLKDAEKELYPGCKEVTKLSFIVKLYQIKCLCGLSNKACDLILQLFSEVLPKGHCIPNTLAKVQKVIRDLGLDYQKIDACVNDCVLFRKEYAQLESCPICNASRWKTALGNDPNEAPPSRKEKKPVPQKVLRYFPLTPRLQRLFMTEATSSYMQWHKKDRVDDKTMRHPADSLAWKHVDNLYSDTFAKDARNVRLGLASDGFNPFGLMSISHTTWPVILIPYNLPPCLCMKQPYWIMSMIIPGPKSAGNNIDVYLQPLIDELKDLWVNGANTYDAAEKKDFQMYACLLWTINDFPAYAMLCGWSTKGKLACPYCHKYTDYLWLKFGRKHCYMGHRRFLPRNHKWRRNKSLFNNKTEHRDAPVPLSGAEVVQQHQSFEQVTFGRTNKRKRDDNNRWHNWRKKSIFFQLPYWKELLVRHNLDVMHIEKNICDSILGTLLEMDGKSKDSLKARLDLQDMKIRKDQHPEVGKHKYELPKACYALTKEERRMLCRFLQSVKMPDGYASNIKRCVDLEKCKVSGLKTHDCHVIFQKLLPIALRNLLPEKVVIPLLELSQFFSDLCSKELKEEDLVKLSKKIPETLCQLEMIFPPAFFDIMMHLPIHLAEEARLGGPVLYRWMYPIERYLRTLKVYVRNKAQPEGSIAEGYILEECMTFCSRFLDDTHTKLNQPERHEGAAINQPAPEIDIISTIDYSKKGFTYEPLSFAEMNQIRHYIITNCKETKTWVR
jgi:hypothetical protein